MSLGYWEPGDPAIQGATGPGMRSGPWTGRGQPGPVSSGVVPTRLSQVLSCPSGLPGSAAGRGCWRRPEGAGPGGCGVRQGGRGAGPGDGPAPGPAASPAVRTRVPQHAPRAPGRSAAAADLQKRMAEAGARGAPRRPPPSPTLSRCSFPGPCSLSRTPCLGEAGEQHPYPGAGRPAGPGSLAGDLRGGRRSLDQSKL